MWLLCSAHVVVCSAASAQLPQTMMMIKAELFWTLINSNPDGDSQSQVLRGQQDDSIGRNAATLLVCEAYVRCLTAQRHESIDSKPV